MIKSLAILCLVTFSCYAVNVGQYWAGASYTVNNSTATTVKNPLANATTVQMFVKGSGTAQIFTLTFPNGSTIEVPSGGVLTLRFATNLAANDTLGTVITGTGSTGFQVLAGRETKQ